MQKSAYWIIHSRRKLKFGKKGQNFYLIRKWIPQKFLGILLFMICHIASYTLRSTKLMGWSNLFLSKLKFLSKSNKLFQWTSSISNVHLNWTISVRCKKNTNLWLCFLRKTWTKIPVYWCSLWEKQMILCGSLAKCQKWSSIQMASKQKLRIVSRLIKRKSLLF